MELKKSVQFPKGPDFVEIIRKQMVYIDKTLHIGALLDPAAKVKVFTRPSRFGKSLVLNMLYHFCAKTEKSTKFLFENLKVKAEPIYSQQGCYQVILIDFKSLKENNYEDFLEHLKIILSKLYGKFPPLETYLKENQSLALSNFSFTEFKQLLTIEEIGTKFSSLRSIKSDQEAYKTILFSQGEIECLEEILNNKDKKYLSIKLLKNDFGVELAYFQKIRRKQSSVPEIKLALSTLCDLLTQYNQAHQVPEEYQKPIVLIDEFDTPLFFIEKSEKYNKNFFQDALELLVGFLSNGLKNHELNFKTAIITGIIRFSGHNLFSGFNNLAHFHINVKQFADLFGFTHQELEQLSINYQKTYVCSAELLEKNYGGYYCGGVPLAYPWSINEVFTEKKPRKFWINSNENNPLIIKYLSKCNSLIQKNLLTLIDGKSVQFRFNPAIDLEKGKAKQISDKDWLISLLVQTGFLSMTAEIDNEPLCNNKEDKLISLKPATAIIHNLELDAFFKEEYLQTLKNTIKPEIRRLIEDLNALQIETIENALQNIYESPSLLLTIESVDILSELEYQSNETSSTLQAALIKLLNHPEAKIRQQTVTTLIHHDCYKNKDVKAYYINRLNVIKGANEIEYAPFCFAWEGLETLGLKAAISAFYQSKNLPESLFQPADMVQLTKILQQHLASNLSAAKSPQFFQQVIIYLTQLSQTGASLDPTLSNFEALLTGYEYFQALELTNVSVRETTQSQIMDEYLNQLIELIRTHTPSSFDQSNFDQLFLKKLKSWLRSPSLLRHHLLASQKLLKETFDSKNLLIVFQGIYFDPRWWEKASELDRPFFEFCLESFPDQVSEDLRQLYQQEQLDQREIPLALRKEVFQILIQTPTYFRQAIRDDLVFIQQAQIDPKKSVEFATFLIDEFTRYTDQQKSIGAFIQLLEFCMITAEAFEQYQQAPHFAMIQKKILTTVRGVLDKQYVSPSLSGTDSLTMLEITACRLIAHYLAQLQQAVQVNDLKLNYGQWILGQLQEWISVINVYLFSKGSLVLLSEPQKTLMMTCEQIFQVIAPLSDLSERASANQNLTIANSQDLKLTTAQIEFLEQIVSFIIAIEKNAKERLRDAYQPVILRESNQISQQGSLIKANVLYILPILSEATVRMIVPWLTKKERAQFIEAAEIVYFEKKEKGKLTSGDTIKLLTQYSLYSEASDEQHLKGLFDRFKNATQVIVREKLYQIIVNTFSPAKNTIAIEEDYLSWLSDDQKKPTSITLGKTSDVLQEVMTFFRLLREKLYSQESEHQSAITRHLQGFFKFLEQHLAFQAIQNTGVQILTEEQWLTHALVNDWLVQHLEHETASFRQFAIALCLAQIQSFYQQSKLEKNEPLNSQQIGYVRQLLNSKQLNVQTLRQLGQLLRPADWVLFTTAYLNLMNLPTQNELRLAALELLGEKSLAALARTNAVIESLKTLYSDPNKEIAASAEILLQQYQIDYSYLVKKQPLSAEEQRLAQVKQSPVKLLQPAVWYHTLYQIVQEINQQALLLNQPFNLAKELPTLDEKAHSNWCEPIQTALQELGHSVDTGFIEQLANRIEAVVQSTLGVFAVTLVLGTTGEGKSTLVNYLAGCRYKLEDDGFEVRTALQLQSKPEICAVGHQQKSETSVPQVVLAQVNQNQALHYVDLPGSLETRKEQLSLTLLMPAIVAAISQRLRGLVWVISFQTLSVGRGELVREALQGLWVISQAQVKTLRESLVIVVTKVPSGKQIKPAQVIQKLIGIVEQSTWNNPQKQGLKELLSKLAEIPQRVILADIFDDGYSAEQIHQGVNQCSIQESKDYHFILSSQVAEQAKILDDVLLKIVHSYFKLHREVFSVEEEIILGKRILIEAKKKLDHGLKMKAENLSQTLSDFKTQIDALVLSLTKLAYLNHLIQAQPLFQQAHQILMKAWERVTQPSEHFELFIKYFWPKLVISDPSRPTAVVKFKENRIKMVDSTFTATQWNDLQLYSLSKFFNQKIDVIEEVSSTILRAKSATFINCKIFINQLLIGSLDEVVIKQWSCLGIQVEKLTLINCQVFINQQIFISPTMTQIEMIGFQAEKMTCINSVFYINQFNTIDNPIKLNCEIQQAMIQAEKATLINSRIAHGRLFIEPTNAQLDKNKSVNVLSKSFKSSNLFISSMSSTVTELFLAYVYFNMKKIQTESKKVYKEIINSPLSFEEIEKLKANQENEEPLSFTPVLQKNLSSKSFKFPLGLSSFSEIIKRDMFFIDKSQYIGDLLNPKEKIKLFTRPSRFGKTLVLDMLYHFCAKEVSRQSTEALFHDLEVSTNPNYQEVMKQQGKYTVIFLNFGKLKDNNYEEFLDLLKCFLSDLYQRYYFLQEYLEKTNHHDFEFYQKVVKKDINITEIKQALKKLCEFITQYNRLKNTEEIYQKPIILIDEFDTPLFYIAKSKYDYFDQAAELLTEFLANAFKTSEPNFKTAIMTGIIRFSEHNLFEGLNNLIHYDMNTERYAGLFGYTLEELEKTDVLYNQVYQTNAFVERLEELYGGYQIGTQTLFDPWSINQYFTENRQERDYWIETGSKELIAGYLFRSGQLVQENLLRLYEGQLVPFKFHHTIDFSVFKKPSDLDQDVIFSLLVHTGYLTIVTELITHENDLNKELTQTYVKIPNLQLKRFFADVLFKLKLIKSEDRFDENAERKPPSLGGSRLVLEETNLYWPPNKIPRGIPLFVGRKTELQALQKTFLEVVDEKQQIGSSDDSFHVKQKACVVVCCGVAGVGKTQLTLQYAMQQQMRYQHIFWFDASDNQRLMADYQQLVQYLGLDTDLIASSEAFEKLQSWLNQQKCCLLIYDNVLDAKQLTSSNCFSGQHHILITSRYKNWSLEKSALQIDQVLKVTPFTATESLAYFQKSLGKTFEDSLEKQAVLKLSKMSGHLPLTLMMAARYIVQTNIDIASYVKLYQRGEGYRSFVQLLEIIQAIQNPLKRLEQVVAGLKQRKIEDLQQNPINDPYGLKLNMKQQMNEKSYGPVVLALVNRFAYYFEFLKQNRQDYFNKDMQYQHYFKVYQEIRELQVEQSLQLIQQAIAQYSIEKNIKNQGILNEVKETIQSMTELLEGTINAVSQSLSLGQINMDAIFEPFTQIVDLAFSTGQLGLKIQEQQLFYQKNVEQLKEKGLHQQETGYQFLLGKLKSLYEDQLWLDLLRLQINHGMGQDIGLALQFIEQYQQICPLNDLKVLKEVWQDLNQAYQAYQEIRQRAYDCFEVIKEVYDEMIQQQITRCKADSQYVRLVLLGLDIHSSAKQKSKDTDYQIALAYSKTCGDMKENIAQSLLQIGAIHKLEKSQRYVKASWNPLSETYIFRDRVKRMQRWQEIMGQERDQRQNHKPSGMIKTLIEIYQAKPKPELKPKSLTAEDFMKACLWHLFQAVKKIEKTSITELLKIEDFRYFVVDWLRYSFDSYYAAYPESTKYYIEFSAMSEALSDLREVLGVIENQPQQSNSAPKRVTNEETVQKVIESIGSYDDSQQNKQGLPEFLMQCSLEFVHPPIVLKENELLDELPTVDEPTWGVKPSKNTQTNSMNPEPKFLPMNPTRRTITVEERGASGYISGISAIEGLRVKGANIEDLRRLSHKGAKDVNYVLLERSGIEDAIFESPEGNIFERNIMGINLLGKPIDPPIKIKNAKSILVVDKEHQKIFSWELKEPKLLMHSNKLLEQSSFNSIALLDEFDLEISTTENLIEKTQELIKGLKQHQLSGEVKPKLDPEKCEEYLNKLIVQWKDNKMIDEPLIKFYQKLAKKWQRLEREVSEKKSFNVQNNWTQDQQNKETLTPTLEFTLASFIPCEAITHCIRRDLKVENNELIDIAVLRYSHFMNWVKAALWSDEQLNLFGNEKIKSDVLQIQVMFNQITDLKINGTLLCPIVFDHKNPNGSHFSLLVFRKIAHDQVQAIYVDSYGDTANFGDFLVKTFKSRFLQLKSKLQEKLKEDKEQIIIEINKKKQPELTEIPWNLELTTYCEAYQHNNDCAVHVWQNALILTDLDNNAFTIEIFKQKLKEKMLEQSEQVTLLRYQMAMSLQNDELFLQTHQAVVVTGNLLNHVNRIHQSSSKIEQKIELDQINEDEENIWQFSEIISNNANLQNKQKKPNELIEETMTNEEREASSYSFSQTTNQSFFSKNSRSENNNHNISAFAIKNIFESCLKKIVENFIVIELQKEDEERVERIFNYFNKEKISTKDDCYKIKLSEEEYNNIMGENAFQILQMELNFDDDESSSSLDI